MDVIALLGTSVPSAQGVVQVLIRRRLRALVAADVRDLGVHRLRTLLVPLRLFQLNGGDFRRFGHSGARAADPASTVPRAQASGCRGRKPVARRRAAPHAPPARRRRRDAA